MLSGLKRLTSSLLNNLSLVEEIDRDSQHFSLTQLEDLTAFQRTLIGRRSDRMRGRGCVAYMLDTVYIPWADYEAPGNARTWAYKAYTFGKLHPEYGIAVDYRPCPGAIMCQINGSYDYGHVGIVESVEGQTWLLRSADTWRYEEDRRIVCEQGSWFNENVTRYAPYKDRCFIHFPWVEAVW